MKRTSFITIVILLFCSLSATAQIRIGSSTPDKSWIPSTKAASKHEMIHFFNHARKIPNTTNKKATYYEAFGWNRLLENDKKMLYANCVTEAELPYIHGEWGFVHTSSNEFLLYLETLVSDNKSVNAQEIMARIEKKYGCEKNGIPAKWVTGMFRSISNKHSYFGEPVGKFLCYDLIENGIQQKNGAIDVEGSYERHAQKLFLGKLVRINENGIDKESIAFMMKLLSRNINKDGIRYNKNDNGKNTAYLLLFQNKKGKPSLRLLNSDGLRKDLRKAVNAAKKKIAALPNWSFNQYFNADGKLLPGRYLKAQIKPAGIHLEEALDCPLNNKDF